MMICVALLAYVLIKYDTTSIFLRLRNARFHWLALSCVFLYVGVFLCSLRWRAILRGHGRQDSVLRLFSLYIEASFFNLFFPGFVAGDASRIARTSSHGKHPFEAFFAVFIDRFSGFLTTLLYIGCVALLGGYDALGKVWSYTILLALALGFTGLLALINVQLVRRVVRFLPQFLGHQMEKIAAQMHEAVGTLTSRPEVLWQVVIFSILYVFALVPPAYLAARSIDLQIPLAVLMAYVPLTAFVSSLPISIVGVGVRENIYVLVYSAAGFAPEDIIAFGLAFSALVLIINLTGGLLLLLRAVLPK
jgi:uncharacterized protein (TIRG00374 family)